MKTKQLLILLAVLIVLAAIAMIMQNKTDEGWRDEEAVSTILPDNFDAEKVVYIVIEKNGNKLHFHKNEDGWSLTERNDFPVDVSQLGKIVFDLMETRLAQKIQADDATKNELNLAPEAGAVRLSLMDAQQQVLVELMFGKRVEKEADEATMAALYGQAAGIPLGRYVQLQNGVPALVANTFSILDNEPGQWLEQSFFSVKSMKSATLYVGDKEEWSLLRVNGKLTLQGQIPEGFEENTAAINGVNSVFNWMPFIDVKAKSQPQAGMKKLQVIDEEGYAYTVLFGAKEKGGRCLEVKVAWTGADDNVEALDKVKKMNVLMDRFQYLVVPDSLDAIDKVRSQLLTVKKPAK